MEKPRVLIAGSGLAAYFAWRQLGEKAIVVSGSLTNNSLISGHCFCTKSPNSQTLENAIIGTGRNLSDRNLVKFFCSKAKGIEKLPEFSKKTEWSLGFKSPLDFLERFQQKALNARIVELNVLENRLDSVTIQHENGQKQVIECNAIVLCTGGYSHYFTPADSMNYSSPTGLEVAFNAGAMVSGLEFNMFHPFGLGGKCLPTEALSKCNVLSKSNGAEWLKKSILQKSLHDRLSKACLAISHEKGGKLKVEMNNKTFNLTPISHYSNGGLVVDCDSKTSIQGVFAAGEIAFGIQGAERIGGTALTEAVVFGSNAGKKAAIHCDDASPCRISFGKAFFEKSKKRIIDCKKIISGNFGTLNSREKLLEGLEKSSEKDCFFLQALFKAGLARKESRGCFNRIDFPKERKKFEKNFLFKLEKGKVKQAFTE
ncbi:MAG: FAD-binding protein [Candidatus Diapherotrites archaeon]|nr:FAD-binding protein [Candidatus Diapherotrites archaeon]